MSLLQNTFLAVHLRASHKCEINLRYFSASKCEEMPEFCLLQGRVTLHRLGKLGTGDTGRNLNAAKIVPVQVLLFKYIPKQSAVT